MVTPKTKDQPTRIKLTCLTFITSATEIIKISLIYLGTNRSFLCSFRKLFHCSLCHTHKNRLPQARRYNFPFCCMVTEFHQGKLKMYTNSIDFITWRYGGHIEGFHMTSRRPYWCPRQVPWEMNSFVMQTLSFVRINLHRCWPREWKHWLQANPCLQFLPN